MVSRVGNKDGVSYIQSFDVVVLGFLVSAEVIKAFPEGTKVHQRKTLDPQTLDPRP